MITNKTDSVVKLINNLIEEAVHDGADSGGAYHTNQENLMIAISNLLNSLNLVDYEVVLNKDYTNWSTIKILPRKNVFEIKE